MNEINLKFDLSRARNAEHYQLQQTLSRAGVGAKPNFKPGDDKPSSGDTPNDSDSPDEI